MDHNRKIAMIVNSNICTEMIEKIKAPFTEDQVTLLNAYQTNGLFHPFTCCSFNGCDRSDKKLIATKSGWVCPCGLYKQKWAHKFMVDVEINKR